MRERLLGQLYHWNKLNFVQKKLKRYSMLYVSSLVSQIRDKIHISCNMNISC